MSEIPTPAPTGAELEATTGIEMITVEFDGHEYTIPASFEDVDINVMRAFEAGQAVKGAEQIIGVEQFKQLEARFRKAHGGRFTMRELTPLAEKIAEVYGFENAGE